MQLHILHTNDVHSELLSYARLVTQVRSLRDTLTDDGADVLCFDLGDHIDLSNPLSYATMGLINADILRVVNYDGLVFGNNETVTVDPSLWESLARAVQTPILCSNIDSPSGKWNQQAGVQFLRSGVSIGVCGVTVQYENLLKTIGVLSRDPVEAAWTACANLKNNGADIVILLSHLGLHIDEMLADKGIPADIIIGSHTHQFLDAGIKRGNVWIFQAGKYAKAFGHIAITLAPDKAIQKIDGRLLYTGSDVVPDPAVLQVIDRYVPIAHSRLSQPIATLPHRIAHSLFGESEIVNLLCDAMKEELHVDVAIVNGGVVTAGFRAGTVRIGDLHSVCATPMRAVTMDVSGERLWQLLSESLRMDIIARQGIGFGFRGHFVGRLHVSGATIIIDGTSAKTDADEQINNLFIGSAQIDRSQVYRIAVCEYVALSSMFKAIKGPVFAYQAPTLRQMLEYGLKTNRLLDSAKTLRYVHRDESAQMGAKEHAAF